MHGSTGILYPVAAYNLHYRSKVPTSINENLKFPGLNNTETLTENVFKA